MPRSCRLTESTVYGAQRRRNLVRGPESPNLLKPAWVLGLEFFAFYNAPKTAPKFKPVSSVAALGREALLIRLSRGPDRPTPDTRPGLLASGEPQHLGTSCTVRKASPAWALFRRSPACASFRGGLHELAQGVPEAHADGRQGRGLGLVDRALRRRLHLASLAIAWAWAGVRILTGRAAVTLVVATPRPLHMLAWP
jgi:hypothetical protein